MTDADRKTIEEYNLARERCEDVTSITTLAKEAGISRNSLYLWLKDMPDKHAHEVAEVIRLWKKRREEYHFTCHDLDVIEWYRDGRYKTLPSTYETKALIAKELGVSVHTIYDWLKKIPMNYKGHEFAVAIRAVKGRKNASRYRSQRVESVMSNREQAEMIRTLRQRMKQDNLTAADLAKQLGMTRNGVYNWLEGTVIMTQERYDKLMGVISDIEAEQELDQDCIFCAGDHCEILKVTKKQAEYCLTCTFRKEKQ